MTKRPKKFTTGCEVIARVDLTASDYNRPASAGYPLATVKEGSRGRIVTAYIPCVRGPYTWFHKVDFDGVVIGVYGEDLIRTR